jgi:hypothetical protein
MSLPLRLAFLSPAHLPAEWVAHFTGIRTQGRSPQTPSEGVPPPGSPLLKPHYWCTTKPTGVVSFLGGADMWGPIRLAPSLCPSGGPTDPSAIDAPQRVGVIQASGSVEVLFRSRRISGAVTSGDIADWIVISNNVGGLSDQDMCVFRSKWATDSGGMWATDSAGEWATDSGGMWVQFSGMSGMVDSVTGMVVQ